VGITDRLKGLRKKAEVAAAEHKDQIQSAVEKAEVAADQRTGGQYHEQISKAGAKVQTYVENLKPEAAESQDASGVTGGTSPPQESAEGR
jgi:DNA-binding protein H-NS